MKRLQIRIEEELDAAVAVELLGSSRDQERFAFDGDFAAAGFLELRT
jgi:hypothetical protein